MIAKVTTALLAATLAGCATGRQADPRQPIDPGRPVLHAAELLRHHAGVRLEGTGSNLRVYLRGAQEEPLVIVDGMPLMPDARGVLGVIEPRDVAEIRVLSAAAELTFYGARGANGVILVRTKRP